jgi:hypothetical protein
MPLVRFSDDTCTPPLLTTTVAGGGVRLLWNGLLAGAGPVAREPPVPARARPIGLEMKGGER